MLSILLLQVSKDFPRDHHCLMELDRELEAAILGLDASPREASVQCLNHSVPRVA